MNYSTGVSTNWASLILHRVNPTGKEIGRGAYGRVFEVNYEGTRCAAKEVHALLLQYAQGDDLQKIKDDFLSECQIWSTLRHPCVVQFLGVYYPAMDQYRLPVMVMEKMQYSLRGLVEKYNNIPLNVKLSILDEVCLGLRYLHSRNPPIVHRDLTPNNILLGYRLEVKITDLGVAKVMQTTDTKTMTKAPGTTDFMPPECLADRPVYGLSLDVFSYGGVILYTITQLWPQPSSWVQFDPNTGRSIYLSEIQRRQRYLDKIPGGTANLKTLIMSCLENNPQNRPSLAQASMTIKEVKDMCSQKSSRDGMSPIVWWAEVSNEQKSQVTSSLTTALEMNEQLRRENDVLKANNTQLQSNNDVMKHENKQLTTLLDKMAVNENEIQRMRNENATMKDETGHLKIENDMIKAENIQLKIEIDDLKARHVDTSKSKGISKYFKVRPSKKKQWQQEKDPGFQLQLSLGAESMRGPHIPLSESMPPPIPIYAKPFLNNGFSSSSISKRSSEDNNWQIPRDNIQLSELLAEGKHTVLYRATVFNFGKSKKTTEVTVKQVKDNNSSPEEVKVLIEEMDLIRDLGIHPNVVNVLAVCTVGDPVYLLMDYFVHGDLLGFLRATRGHIEHYTVSAGTDTKVPQCSVQPQDLLSLANQVANGMTFLEEKKVAHGSLCARNVLVGTGLQVKIYNYRQKNDDQSSYAKWMAPETLFDGTANTTSDVWSFGVTLWEIVTIGGSPYFQMRPEDMRKVLEDGYRMPNPDHCSEEIYKIMQDCWEYDPQDRPSFDLISYRLETLSKSKLSHIDLILYDEVLYSQFEDTPQLDMAL